MLYSYLQRGAFTCREAGKLAVLYRVLYNANFARGRVVSRRAAPALASSLRALALSRGRARAARGSDAPGAGARGLRYRIELAHKVSTPLSLYTHRELLEWGLLWGASVRVCARCRWVCGVRVWPMHRIFVATGGPTFTPSPRCSANNLFQLERQAPSKLADVARAQPAVGGVLINDSGAGAGPRASRAACACACRPHRRGRGRLRSKRSARRGRSASRV